MRQLLITLLFFSHFVSKASPASNCPKLDLGETAEDCPWAGITRELVSGDVATGFKKKAPQVLKQIQKDQKKKAWLALWGESINFDELAKGIIVQHPIIDFVLAEAGVTQRKDRVVHAGIEHTYGYLFSDLKTSFGFKRARWVRDDIEVGFGLTRGTLGPEPQSGTLFQNVTFFIGQIAFAEDPKPLTVLTSTESAELRKFAFKKLSRTRLEEEVEIENRQVLLRTDLVPFFVLRDGKPNTHLLIYSVHDSAKSGPQLITAFPVEKNFVEKILSADGLGKGKPISTRYNAYVEGVTGKSLTGTRRILGN